MQRQQIKLEEWTEKLGARLADRLGDHLMVRMVFNATPTWFSVPGNCCAIPFSLSKPPGHWAWT